MVLERKPFMFTTDKISCNFHYDKIKEHWWFIYNKHLCIKINIHVFSFQNVACFTVNGRLTNLSWYPWENHSCLQLIKCHVTSIMSKSNDIDGLFIITIYVFKLTVMLLLVRMWPVSLWMGDLKTFHGIWEKTINVYNWKDIM